MTLFSRGMAFLFGGMYEGDELRSKILAYRPGDTVTIPDRILFPERLFIGIFGKGRSGKTSVVNSMRCAINKELSCTEWLPTGSKDVISRTMFRQRVKLTEHISVIDNRGWKAADFNVLTECDAQLGNS